MVRFPLLVMILAPLTLMGGCGTTWQHRAASDSPEDQRTRIMRIPDDVRRPTDDRLPDPAVVARLVHERVNAHRRQSRRSTVERDQRLLEVARKFAGYMARTGRYGHQADGKTPGQRVALAGYEFCVVSENLAYLFDSNGFEADELAKAFVNGWIDSPGHHRNMIDPDVTQTGVAVTRTDAGEFFAVQVFARPESARIEFSLRNTTEAAVRYEVDGETFDLPPRATRTHGACRPPAVNLFPGRRALDVGAGGTFEFFTSRGGHTAVRRVERGT